MTKNKGHFYTNQSIIKISKYSYHIEHVYVFDIGASYYAEHELKAM